MVVMQAVRRHDRKIKPQRRRERRGNLLPPPFVPPPASGRGEANAMSRGEGELALSNVIKSNYCKNATLPKKKCL
jgi:hypothetical protein